MPERSPTISELILDRPTCLACLAGRTGVSDSDIRTALEVLADALNIYREVDHCQLCGEEKDVAFIKSV